MERSKRTHIIAAVAVVVILSLAVPAAYAFIAETINSGNNAHTDPMTIVVSDTYGDPSSLMEVSLPIPDKGRITSVTDNGPWSFNDAYVKKITGYIYAQCPDNVGKMRVWIDMKDMRSWSAVERVTLSIYDEGLSRGTIVFNCSDTEEKTLFIKLKADAVNTTYTISPDTLNDDPGYTITGLGTGSSVINAAYSKGTVTFQCSDNGENTIAVKVKADAGRTEEDLRLNAGSGYEFTGVGASSTVSAETYYHGGDIKFKCGAITQKWLVIRVGVDYNKVGQVLTLTTTDSSKYTITAVDTNISTVKEASLAGGTLSFKCDDRTEKIIKIGVTVTNDSNKNVEQTLTAGSGYSIRGLGTGSDVSTASYQENGKIIFKYGNDASFKLLVVRVRADYGQENKDLILSRGSNYKFTGVETASSTVTIKQSGSDSIKFRCSDNNDQIIAIMVKADNGQENTELQLFGGSGFSITGVSPTYSFIDEIHVLSHNAKVGHQYTLFGADSELLEVGGEPNKIELPVVIHPTKWDANDKDWNGKRFDIDVQYRSEINTNPYLLGDDLLVSKVNFVAADDEPIPTLSVKYYIGYKDGVNKDYNVNNDLIVKTYAYQGNVINPPNAPDGYEIEGWYINLDTETGQGTGTEWIFAENHLDPRTGKYPGTVWSGNELTLYAKYTIITYDVTFDWDGLLISGDWDRSYDVNSPSFGYQSYTGTVDDKTPKQDTTGKYNLKGWTGTGLSGINTDISIPKGSIGDRSYTAEWTYEVTFDANTSAGGTGQSYKQTINRGVTASLTKMTGFTAPTGKEFYGWNTAANGSGTSYADGASVENLGKITLYAIWKEKRTITFNANDGSGSPPTSTQEVWDGVDTPLNKNTFTAPSGKIFKEWNVTVGTTPTVGTKYADGASITVTGGNVTLAATWDTKFTITFNAHDGSGSPPTSTQDVCNGVSTPLKKNTFTAPSGKIFDKWTEEQGGGGEVYLDGASITVGANKTLYAQWVNKATISFNANGGTGTMSDQECKENVPITLDANGFTKSGWVFDRWNTQPDGSGTSYADRASYTPTGNITLYAIWKCEITYDKNTGVGTMSSDTVYSYNAKDIIRSNAYTAPYGMCFYGWNTRPDGKGTAYNPGDVLTVTGSMKLYAIWGYEITFNANGGLGDPTTQKIPLGITTELNANPFTKSESTFYGWKTEAGGTDVLFSNQQKVIMYRDADVISKTSTIVSIQCHYDELHTVMLAFTGAINTPYTLKASNGCTIVDVYSTATISSFTGSMISFQCPSTNVQTFMITVAAKAVDTTYTLTVSSGTISNATFNTTLLAMWECSVSFDLNVAPSGFEAPETIRVKYGGTVSEPDMGLDAYRVTWYKEKACTNRFIFDTDVGLGQASTVTADITIYAKWELEVYLIYNPLPGVEDQRDQSIWVPYGEPITIQNEINSDIPSKWSGDDPSWWNTNSLGRGVYFQSTVSYTFAYPMSLYAIWHDPPTIGPPNPYVPETQYYIRYVSNGGSGYMDAQPVVKVNPTTYATLKDVNDDKFYKEGWAFYNWNLRADGRGTPYAPGDNVNISELGGNIALFAMWRHYVLFDANGGTGTMALQLFEDNVNTNLNSNSFTKTNYTFSGWNTSPDGTGTAYTDGQTINRSENLVLYAQWTATVTLGLDGGTSTIAKTIVTYNSSNLAYKTSEDVEVTPFVAPTKSGHPFLGFFDGETKVIDADGTLVAGVSGYTDSGKKWIRTEESTSLTAKWGVSEYTITLSTAGATTPNVDKAIATFDSSSLTYKLADATVSFAAPAKTNYIFAGFFTQSSGGVTVIDSSGAFVSNVSGYTDASGNWKRGESITLYAQWTISVTLTASDATTTGTTSLTATFNSESFYTIDPPTKTEYKFLGYFTEPSNGSKIIDANDLSHFVSGTVDGYISNGKWVSGEAKTLYAHWAPVYTVTFSKTTGGTLVATVSGDPITSGDSFVSGTEVIFTYVATESGKVPTGTGEAASGWTTVGKVSTKAVMISSAAVTVSITGETS